MKHKATFWIFIIGILILNSSCMSIFKGTTQTVRFTSQPPGAEVIVNGKSSFQLTPCELELEKKVPKTKINRRNEYVYTFVKDGYTSIEIKDRGETDPKVLGNCFTIVFFPIAMAIDFATGAAFKYQKEINVALHPDESVKDKTPPVISIVSPKTERGFVKLHDKRQIFLKFTVKDDNFVSYVSVNNMKLVENEEGFYQITLNLAEGENTIKIKAIDSRDNVANEILTVKYEKESYQYTEADEIPEIIWDAGDETTGKYYALIIGVEDYKDPEIQNLSNPVKDAENLYKVLTGRYTFESKNVLLLRNPSMKDITGALEDYFNQLNDNDNLLIFYAGHGYWDERFKQGYWLPADAQRKNRGTWIPNSLIRDYMRGIPARHTLLITDACFSGGIFKSRDAFKDASKAINQLYELPSRKAMTSGTLKEVPDKSVFIEYLIKRLEENKQKYLPSEQLFASFKIAVINNSPNAQVPQFGEVRETGDEGGDFIFILK
ncbi:MAG: caspase family protein [Bacteroidales bacterium]|nr:caspase family protein [Bacteroidales bacterium]